MKRHFAARIWVIAWMVLGWMVTGAVAQDPQSVTAGDDRVAKALVIGIDGVRPDAMIIADTPNINRLIANGTFDPKCQILGERYRENDTVSGPSWSSILTGVWADKHGVNDNSFRGRRYELFPNFLKRVKRADPASETVSVVATWRPIAEYIVTGADISHFVPLAGPDTTDVNVPADLLEIDTRDGEWHHLLGMRRGETLFLYLNGQQVAAEPDRAGPFELQGSRYYFGRDARDGATEFNGQLRGMQLWNRSLSESEIQSIAEGRTPQGAEPIADLAGPFERQQIDLDEKTRQIGQGDFAIGGSFRTTDPGRNILMGNYGDAAHGHLNLELHTENRVRLYVNPGGEQADRMAREEQTDREVATKAAELLSETDPTAMWVYLHHPDSAGHAYGFSPLVPEYMQAIELVDLQIGRIIDAINNRPNVERENWIIVVTTDHGGYRTGHGGGHDIPEVLTGFLLVSGDAVHNRISPQPTTIVDVVPTVLQHLSIEIDPELDGQPVGLR